MKLNIFKIFCAVALICSGVLLFAFSPANEISKESFLDYGECSLSESHTESVETWVRVPEGESGNLHDFDKLELTKSLETYQVNRCITNRNAVNTERILLSSTKAVESWKPQVGRVVSDATGLKMYDSRAKLLKSIPISAKGVAQRAELSNALSNNSTAERGASSSVFPLKITSSEVNARRGEAAEGQKITQLENGNLLVSTKTLAEEGTGRENVNVVELLAIGEDSYVPKKIQERRYQTSPFSGVCIEYIQTTTFSNYSVNNTPLRGETGGRR